MKKIIVKEEIVVCVRERRTSFLYGWFSKLAYLLCCCVVKELVSFFFAKLHGE
ncbi:MAG: hypothetical protein MJ249_11845 [Kiritimatiellae bacterium]|nr:hypothetical protein [Kiritimatiellia bacterium]